MRQLSHSGGDARSPERCAAACSRAARGGSRARGCIIGHGTDNARDEAAALLWHVLRAAAAAERRPRLSTARVAPRAQARFEALLQRRIRERMPAVYLTRRCWFAGLPMYVDQRVLIPRSPIAELIERRFAPWIEPARVRRILDLGTGSGCIAIACARAFPQRPGRCGRYLRRRAGGGAHQHPPPPSVGGACARCSSDHFAALGARQLRYYRQQSALRGAARARRVCRRNIGTSRGWRWRQARTAWIRCRIILRDAAAHLNPGGILIVEVGNSETALRRAFPRLPFIWLAFERGGGGVFVLEREQLHCAREAPT